MLDFIALYFLCRMNGRLATQKGLKAGTWRWYTILAWITAEMVGALFAIGLFGPENLVAVVSMGIASAFGGYLFIKSTLDKKPDAIEDEIDRIGVDDLQPPRK
ncbi:MAG: hypothetical protein JWP81_1313 [Ferruginibacter sp.]|nr:hypothetical protein [Ferruginibacter sp.]